MTDLETQVVKIQLGDLKQANSYVYTLAEKIDASESELYMICELPLFNPAAADECQRIAEALAASLKRSYRKTVNAQTFENALAIINEELGKLVSMGKTHWLGKLNAVLAVKHGHNLSVASAGKISALLYRDGSFASIAEQAAPSHPLKTFENFSVGRVRLGDLLVLSTTQLFNHISVDRIKNILKKNELPEAAQEIIQTLQDSMGPEVACGTILALQVEPGVTADEEVDLEAYMAGPQIRSEVLDDNWLDKLKNVHSTAMTIGKNVGSDLKKKIASKKLSDVIAPRTSALEVVQNQFKRVGNKINTSAIKGYSRQKKFFLISAAVLLIALITNVVVAQYFKGKNDVKVIPATTIESMQKLADDANAALLYGDEPKAASLLSSLQGQLNEISAVPEEQKGDIDKIRSLTLELQNKINKVTDVMPERLGTLSNAENLITLPSSLGTETNRTIVSYNRADGSIADNVLKTSEPIIRSVFLKDNRAAVYNGTELLIWNIQTGILGGAFSESVPAQSSSAGLKVYPVNNRVYMIDTAQGRVMSFAASDRDFSKPTVSIAPTEELKNATDLAIDGNIYIATGGNILKYNSGARQEFTPNISGLSNSIKLYTQVDYTNLYVLDISNKRIIVLGKDGSLVATLTSKDFDNLKDFAIEESTRTIFVLNGSALLRVKY